jgi:predicted nucleic acid-binding protein
MGARQPSGALAISVVSLTEIAGGMRSPERREVMRLLGSMQRFEVTEQVAWRAATLMQEYRGSHSGIGLGDYLIAATALTEGLELATLNIRHYPCFPNSRAPSDASDPVRRERFTRRRRRCGPGRGGDSAFARDGNDVPVLPVPGSRRAYGLAGDAFSRSDGRGKRQKRS